MEVKLEMTEDILIANLVGELDHHCAADVRTCIDKAMESFRAKHLIMDFSKVTFMDSAGIGVVMGRYNRIHEKGGRIFVSGAGPYVYRILEMAGVFLITELCESPKEGILVLEEARKTGGEV